MTFSIRGNFYLFPIKLREETIIDDYNGNHYFKGPLEEGKMSFVVKAYRPVNKVDFQAFVTFWKVDNQTDYEIKHWPNRKYLSQFEIKEEDDYIIFRYYIDSTDDPKSLSYYFVSHQHYKIGFYLDCEPYKPENNNS